MYGPTDVRAAGHGRTGLERPFNRCAAMSVESALSGSERNALPVILFYRASTKRQGVSRLDLEVQRAAVPAHVAATSPVHIHVVPT
jgi:hypothetical protein